MEIEDINSDLNRHISHYNYGFKFDKSKSRFMYNFTALFAGNVRMQTSKLRLGSVIDKPKKTKKQTIKTKV